jgi:hypothetical protein
MPTLMPRRQSSNGLIKGTTICPWHAKERLKTLWTLFRTEIYQELGKCSKKRSKKRSKFKPRTYRRMVLLITLYLKDFTIDPAVWFNELAEMRQEVNSFGLVAIDPIFELSILLSKIQAYCVSMTAHCYAAFVKRSSQGIRSTCRRKSFNPLQVHEFILISLACNPLRYMFRAGQTSMLLSKRHPERYLQNLTNSCSATSYR